MPSVYYLYLITFFRWFNPFIPVIAIIGHTYGINYYQLFVLQSVFSAAVLLGELPAGFLADYTGRKRLLCVSSLFFFAGSFFMLVYPHFWTWLVGECCLGLAVACYSGLDTSLLYAYTGDRGGSRYQRCESTMQMIARCTEALSAGCIFFASWSMLMPLYLSLTAACCLFVLALFLPSDRPSNRPNQRFASRTTWLAFLSPFTALYRDDSRRFTWLLCLLAYSALQSVVLLSVFFLLQVIASLQALSFSVMSFVWVMYFMLSGFASRLSVYGFDYQRGYLCMLPMLSALFCGLAMYCGVDYYLYLLLFFAVVFGFKMPLVNSLLNAYAPPSLRVLTHSLDSFFTRLLFIFFSPVVGYLTQYVSIDAGLGLLMCTIILLIVVTLYLLMLPAGLPDRLSD